MHKISVIENKFSFLARTLNSYKYYAITSVYMCQIATQLPYLQIFRGGIVSTALFGNITTPM